VTQTAPRPTAPHPTSAGVADRLAEAVRPFIGGDLPVRLEAWDGSVAGPEGAPLVVLRSPDALRRLLWHPGELGAAQAYVTGELDVPEQDGWTLESALTHAFAVGAARGLSGVRLSPRAMVDAIRTAADLGALGRPPAAPASQAAFTAATSPPNMTVTRPASARSLPSSSTFAAFSPASAASIAPTSPFVSTRPRA